MVELDLAKEAAPFEHDERRVAAESVARQRERTHDRLQLDVHGRIVGRRQVVQQQVDVVQPLSQLFLQGVDLDVRQHEIFGIIGRSGAGKTSVINAIAGLLRPTRGRILVDGEPLLTWDGYAPTRAALRGAVK